MFKTLPPGSTSIVAIVMILFGAANLARAADEIARFDPPSRLPENPRAIGLVDVDSPMSIGARFNSTYTDDLDLSDTLARPHAFATGAWLPVDPSLESRFALTKLVSEKIEIGVVWWGRSPISKLDLFDFERHSVAAMIRVSP